MSSFLSSWVVSLEYAFCLKAFSCMDTFGPLHEEAFCGIFLMLFTSLCKQFVVLSQNGNRKKGLLTSAFNWSLFLISGGATMLVLLAERILQVWACVQIWSSCGSNKIQSICFFSDRYACCTLSNWAFAG